MSNKEAQAANDFVITNIRSILKNVSAWSVFVIIIVKL
jgi:hypothetical protein